MDEAAIKRLLEGIGCRKIRNRGNKSIIARCPFQRLHAGGYDTHPSFGVEINTSGTSGFSCYACHKAGWVGLLVEAVERHTGEKFPQSLHDLAHKDGDLSLDAIKQRIENASFWAKFQEVGGVVIDAQDRFTRERVPEPTVLPEAMLDRFKNHTLESILYLRGSNRKLTQETIEKWELGWDAEDRRLVIPIRNRDGKLVAYSRRLYQEPGEKRLDRRGKPAPKYLHSTGFQRDYVLYGEHLLTPGRKAYLNEGFFHVIWMHQCGYRNPLAIMGTFLSEVQQKKIKKWFDEVVIMVDGDDPGRRMADAVRKSLEPDVRVSTFQCPEGLDANDLAPEELHEALGTPDVLVN